MHGSLFRLHAFVYLAGSHVCMYLTLNFPYRHVKMTRYPERRMQKRRGIFFIHSACRLVDGDPQYGIIFYDEFAIIPLSANSGWVQNSSRRLFLVSGACRTCIQRVKSV
jgi:hypothetical protein